MVVMMVTTYVVQEDPFAPHDLRGRMLARYDKGVAKFAYDRREKEAAFLRVLPGDQQRIVCVRFEPLDGEAILCAAREEDPPVAIHGQEDGVAIILRLPGAHDLCVSCARVDAHAGAGRLGRGTAGKASRQALRLLPARTVRPPPTCADVAHAFVKAAPPNRSFLVTVKRQSDAKQLCASLYSKAGELVTDVTARPTSK